jgi:hypothetical protein
MAADPIGPVASELVKHVQKTIAPQQALRKALADVSAELANAPLPVPAPEAGK